MKLKLKFSLRPRLPRLKEIRKLWMLEVIIAGIFLLVLLGWDAWIYFAILKTTNNTEPAADKSKIMVLKKNDLEAISKKLDSYDEFLKNPNFTF